MKHLREPAAVIPIIGVAVLAAALGLFSTSPSETTRAEAPASPVVEDRSPVDLVLTGDDRYLLTANQTSDTVSLVETATGKVVAEAACGKRPTALALTPDGKRMLVSATSGTLTLLTLDGAKLTPAGSIQVGFEPRGVAVAPDGKTAYVAQAVGGTVAVIDLDKKEVRERISVGKWPRHLALTPDGTRLAVGINGAGGVAVVDTAAAKLLYVEDFLGLNLGQMHVAADGKHVYFPWITSRTMPITSGNIRQGWVLGSRIARVRLDGPARREALTLDPSGKAVADPHGLALSPDGQWLVCTASGTHELLVLRTAGLPLQDYGGPGDHINPDLLKDPERFSRIPLGGRPLAVRFSSAGRRVYVANYLANAVQAVDLETKKVTDIPLGGAAEPTLARRGAAIFFDGQRSLDQWYSCHSCHFEGHTTSVTIDNRSDGRSGYAKSVLTLRNVTRTGPYRWNGFQKDLNDTLRKAFVDTMQGKEPSGADLEALVAYLDTLGPAPSPFREADGALSAAAQRGQDIFKGDKAGCSRCHSGPLFTDGKVHDVGLSKLGDPYRGFKTPSLLGVHDRVLYLHDGRARSLEDVLKGPHNPAKVTRQGELSDAELQDLIAYLKSL